MLVIDDSIDVLRRLHVSAKHQVGGVPWLVKVVTVHIELSYESESGRAHFAEKSIKDILAACARPFDLILADYGYVGEKTNWADLGSGKIAIDQFEKQIRTA